LAALETLRVVKEVGATLPVHLEAIDFTDEEGTLVGMLGSSALTGALQLEALQGTRGGAATLEAALSRANLTEQGLLAAARDPDSLAGYFELHIEQGMGLVQAPADIGVVTSIVGAHSYRLAFQGRADHAGTRPVADRRDAGQGASAFNLAAREIVLRDFPQCRVNVGHMQFLPGAFNIVPARVILALEFRAPDDQTLERLGTVLLEQAHAKAKQFGLALEVEWLGKWKPASMSASAQQAIVDAAGALGLSHIPLFSGAGHDAQWLARVCPAGMIFVPSLDGISHSPDEFTPWEDCVNGANTLLQAALHFATMIVAV
jgi:N-carbamoyl-L-amino-acid hydrolase